MKILDCTLRDGGYCNKWEFGFENIKKVTSGLCDADIDIIECGFLTERVKHHPNVTQFNTLEEIKKILPDSKKTEFVCMMNYGEYNVETIPEYDGTSIAGIRIAFHKKNIVEALNVGKQIKSKGYKLYLQPMVSLNYSDEEFLSLIRMSNELSPHAFYIVDSFGVMKQKDLIRLFYLVEHNLMEDISIGFHSHNNMQLAYSNAQTLLGTGSRHKLIIDSSVYGMGRGAGNLNTELFVEYLNDNYDTNYRLKPLLNIIDEILTQFYQRDYWGYSLPNYLSAKYNTHPNYAGYLDSKKTLTMENMDDIFSMLDDDKRVSYDKEYIENLYVQYLASGNAENAHLEELQERVRNNTILMIAPGKSCNEEKDKLINAIKENVITISINFDYLEINTDYIFLSNIRRFRELPKDKLSKCIITSNIPSMDSYLKTDYKELLNSNEAVMDNAGLMLIKLMVNLGCKEILLAGLDGYEYDASKNYIDQNLRTDITKEWIEKTNSGMEEVLKGLKENVEIRFLTTPKYIKI